MTIKIANARRRLSNRQSDKIGVFWTVEQDSPFRVRDTGIKD